MSNAALAEPFAKLLEERVRAYYEKQGEASNRTIWIIECGPEGEYEVAKGLSSLWGPGIAAIEDKFRVVPEIEGKEWRVAVK